MLWMPSGSVVEPPLFGLWDPSVSNVCIRCKRFDGFVDVVGPSHHSCWIGLWWRFRGCGGSTSRSPCCGWRLWRNVGCCGSTTSRPCEYGEYGWRGSTTFRPPHRRTCRFDGNVQRFGVFPKGVRICSGTGHFSFVIIYFVSCTCTIWAPPSEFVSSSIPSWQSLTAHAQPFRGAMDLAFCLKVPLDSLLVWASSGGSGETARMRRLAWTFAARIGDKYQIRLTRSIYHFDLWMFKDYTSPPCSTWKVNRTVF